MVVAPGTVLASDDDSYVVQEPLEGDDTRYRALVERNEREVVLEVRELGTRTAADALADLAAEVELLESVSHPNVPTFYEVFPLERDGSVGALVFVHEHLDGLSLEALRRQGRRLSPREMRGWFSQILGVLAHLKMQPAPISEQHVVPSTVWLRSDRESFLVGLGSNRATACSGGLHGLALTYLALSSGLSLVGLVGAPLDVAALLGSDDRMRPLLEAMTDPDPRTRLVDAQEALERVAQLRAP